MEESCAGFRPEPAVSRGEYLKVVRDSYRNLPFPAANTSRLKGEENERAQEKKDAVEGSSLCVQQTMNAGQRSAKHIASNKGAQSDTVPTGRS